MPPFTWSFAWAEFQGNYGHNVCMVQTLRIICVIATVITVAIMVKVGEFSEVKQALIFLVFLIVVNAPYCLGWIFAGNFHQNKTGLMILAIGVIGAAAFGLYAYYYTFFTVRETDPQDALIFVVLPVYQSGGIIAAFLLAKLVSRFR